MITKETIKNKFKNFIKLMKQIIKNRRAIMWAVSRRITINFTKRDSKFRQIVKNRKKTCSGCKFNSRNTKVRPYGQLLYPHCIDCGCMISTKPYSEENTCPKGFWKE